MNNGKIRIYELSRELDLENKDILAICDRLNIAVKSHSSTITGEDAAQIRSAAKSARAGKAKPRQPEKAHNGARPPVRKQQILEIRRHRTAPKPPNAPEPPQSPEEPAAIDNDEVSQGEVDALMTPPSRPEAPTRPSSTQLKPPVSRPQSPGQAEAESPQPPKPKTASPPEPEEQPAEPSEDKATAPAAKAPSKPKPELIGPPPKPTRPKPKVTNRRAQADTSEPAAKSARQPTIPIREVDDDDDDGPKLKPKPKLRRPKPSEPQQDEQPVTPEQDDTEDSRDARDDSAREPLLKRPSPSRSQRRKTREEPVDEEQEMRPKADKKSKRRQAIIEDDDELEEVIEGGSGGQSDASSNLSVSLARPPKQKKASASKPSAPATRSYKPPSRDRSGSSRQQRRERQEQATQQERPEILTLTSELTVHELAAKIVVPETDIIKSLFFKGIAANINQTLDVPTAKMVAEEFDILVETAEAESEAKKITEMLDDSDLESLVRRPPVVTIMGHVDHGKTTLLDSIRKTKVAQGEAGGITQHIGAYHVDVDHEDDSQQIVFLDTPGHEAFTAMRARGARVTDIAILVVAADDGVRPQTIEAISHAKAAGVPIVVAINKIDKETAQPDRVKQELMEHGLVPEEWGGDAIMVPVSAIAGENLDNLLEMLLLVAEIEDLQANPDRLAKGTVIEANLDKARGPVATLLVQNGTLKVGDAVVAGSVFGKVRAMIDDRGQRVTSASPSFAVEVLGLNDVPAAGDEFAVYGDEKEARAVADSRATEQRQSRLQQAMASRRVTLSSLSAQAQEGDLKELNLLLKADVQGSLEAILAALQQLPQNEVQVRVLLAAPGEISETDVDLAAASGAVIIGFNTTLAPGARQAADRLGVDVRDYDIIYKLLEDIQGAMEGLLEPELVEESLGQVEVRAVFPVRKGSVAGSYVQSGKVTRNCHLRVLRQGEVVYTGKLDSLKRMKDDVKEVAAGFECGIGIDGFNDWKEGDIIEAFRLVTKRRTLAMAR
ncbi:Translation elongation factor EF-4, membrane-bound GTPase [Halomicronema hongdechloris C2206]|uniref:Translation initiation factor IF-2 n=1 Tax=Halomicronema hongdechloris C2206 TaxID=1641165 RepID=A0A1Z3HHT1_9CYAN|nr:translation initiation factor IF-2 [Halomicronema hongdechloris]ASC69845.1 Translation elongation factor EF-4, membrane-bound GTPase [Halomicronema hongdechloris C2206]